MSKSVYSFGEDSPVKFKISDKLAERWNDAAVEWYKGQERFNQKFGRRWNPRTEPIVVNWNRSRQKAWDDFAKVYKDVLKKYGPYHENDLMDDFLVKNSSEKALNTTTTGVGQVIAGLAGIKVTMPAARRWKRAVTVAVACGALYGFLKRP